MAKYIINILAFFDRSYNRLFNAKDCLKIPMSSEFFEYNDIALEGNNLYRCLGKQWYIKQKSKNP